MNFLEAFNELNKIYEGKTALKETSVGQPLDDVSILPDDVASSNILEYFPNAKQVQAYVDKAKAVELEEAAKGLPIRVVLYEVYYMPGLVSMDDPYHALEDETPIRIYYDSTENPEVVKKLVEVGALTEAGAQPNGVQESTSVQEANSISGKERTMRGYGRQVARGYWLSVTHVSLYKGETVAGYKKRLETQRQWCSKGMKQQNPELKWRRVK